MLDSSPFITEKLPLDHEGFTLSFDINHFDPKTVLQFYNKYGLVIFDNILDHNQIQKSIDQLWQEIIDQSQGEIKRNDPQTWKFYGFLDRYGFVGAKPLDRLQMWKNRCHPNVYKAFKRIYQISSNQTISERLLAQFDRGSLLRPTKDNPNWVSKNIYHFDINPWWWTGVEPVEEEEWRRQNSYDQSFSQWLGEGNYVPKVRNFTKFQGVLAFSDTNPESGGFQCVCGFQNYIKQWCTKNRYYTYITSSPELMANMQKCYQRAGSILLFSRQLPHNIYPNRSEHFRYAEYLRIAPQSALMLTQQERENRKKEVMKMLPKDLDVKNEICCELFMLDQVTKTSKKLQCEIV